MEFDYRKEPDKTKPKKQWIKRPKIQIDVRNGDKHVQLICLVDSGADDCMFHSSIGEILGLDLKSGKHKPFGGIAKGVVIDSYLHEVEIQVQGFQERVWVLAAFCESSAVDGILGQSGFFENYKVEFEGYRGKLDISPRPA
jgi:hypothetical protein